MPTMYEISVHIINSVWCLASKLILRRDGPWCLPFCKLGTQMTLDAATARILKCVPQSQVPAVCLKSKASLYRRMKNSGLLIENCILCPIFCLWAIRLLGNIAGDAVSSRFLMLFLSPHKMSMKTWNTAAGYQSVGSPRLCKTFGKRKFWIKLEYEWRHNSKDSEHFFIVTYKKINTTVTNFCEQFL